MGNWFLLCNISPDHFKAIIGDAFVEVNGYRPIFFSNRCIAPIHCKKVLEMYFEISLRFELSRNVSSQFDDRVLRCAMVN